MKAFLNTMQGFSKSGQQITNPPPHLTSLFKVIRVQAPKPQTLNPTQPNPEGLRSECSKAKRTLGLAVVQPQGLSPDYVAFAGGGGGRVRV